MIGRGLYDHGQAVFEITVDGRGQVELIPVSDWQVTGGYGNWEYRLQIAGPDEILTRYRPSAAVLHLKYGVSAGRSWAGTSPGGSASSTHSLMGNLEARLAQEAGGPVGAIVTVPELDAGLQKDISALIGRNVLVATGEYGEEGTKKDFTRQRIGASPPDVLEALRRSVGADMSASAGVPPGLYNSGSDSSALRESYRIFLHSTIAPIARIISVELADKLNTPGLKLTFDSLNAADVSGKARATMSLVNAGVPLPAALQAVGLLESEAA